MQKLFARDIEQALISWKQQDIHKPLLLRGARQVGKSHIVEQFGRTHFDNIVTINFEFQNQFAQCFDSLEPVNIINNIYALSGQKITAGETLLFLDEIQECPKAILALRYFKEQMPELHVIAAGSLLEFVLNSTDFRMPVGRIECLFLKPISFKEFLSASGNDQLLTYLANATLQQNIPKPVHNHLLNLVQKYMVLGGMPEVISNYFDNQDLQQVQAIQASLLHTFRNDFAKYDKHVNHKYLQQIFTKIPSLIAQHIKYVNINPDIQARDIKPALTALYDAGLVYPIYWSAASGIPLNALINEKKFKLLFLDVGLVKYVTGLDANLLLQNDVMLINRGALAEQFVGQELLAYEKVYRPGELFYWSREKISSSAEVDFVINYHTEIIPIEVKSGTTGRLKSLQIFLQEKHAKLGIRISQKPLAFENNILSVPLYMISELPRLIAEMVA